MRVLQVHIRIRMWQLLDADLVGDEVREGEAVVDRQLLLALTNSIERRRSPIWIYRRTLKFCLWPRFNPCYRNFLAQIAVKWSIKTVRTIRAPLIRVILSLKDIKMLMRNWRWMTTTLMRKLKSLSKQGERTIQAKRKTCLIMSHPISRPPDQISYLRGSTLVFQVQSVSQSSQKNNKVPTTSPRMTA